MKQILCDRCGALVENNKPYVVGFSFPGTEAYRWGEYNRAAELCPDCCAYVVAECGAELD